MLTSEVARLLLAILAETHHVSTAMTAQRTCILLALATLATSLHGFYSQSNKGEKLIEAHESSFAPKSQIEHYETVFIHPDGSVDTGEMLLIYAYGEEVTYGIVHFIKPKALSGFTVLSVQELGKLPQIYYTAPDEDSPLALSSSKWKERFFETPWHFEDILDDDREDWTYQNRGIVQINGVLADLVESAYGTGELKDRSAYSKREVYLAREDSRFLKCVYYGRDGDPLKSFEAGRHHDFGTPDAPRIRCTRLIVSDYRSGAMLILSLKDSVYDIELPERFFAPAQLPQWAENNTPQALILARGAK